MMLAPIVALATTLSAPMQAAPPQAPGPLPLAVRRSMIALNVQCKEAGGVPGRSPDLLKTADLTGDGLPDYVLDVARYDCGGAPSAMANGQGGSGVEVLVGGPGNTATSAYSNSVYGIMLETVGSKPRLWLDVAALECGQRNAASLPFARWKFCSRALVWNAATRSFAFAPLAQARAPR